MIHYSGNKEDQYQGHKLIAEGKVGSLIIAGGQATRLGIPGPKGAVAVTSKGESLFEIFCKRTKGPLCIMTSPLNHDQTIDFFQKQNFFGLNPSTLWFFQQSMLPFLDENLKPLDQCGPDGNGHALHHFFWQGIWKEWSDRGIEYLNIIPVDNVLADPFDPELVGLTARLQNDVTLKAVPRTHPLEKMGALTEKEGRFEVVEYFEITEKENLYLFSHTGMFCISMPFIEDLVGKQRAQLPLHLAKKQGLYKQERFLFDILPFTHSTAALIYEKERVYCPLKNATGEGSLERVLLKTAQMSDSLF